MTQQEHNIASLFWKSGYTEPIHKMVELCGFWAIVKCMRCSIPGHVAELTEGKLCDKCFPLDEPPRLAQSLRQVAEAGRLQARGE